MLLRKITDAVVDRMLKVRKTGRLDIEAGASIRVVSATTGLPTATISTAELAMLDVAAGNRLVDLTAATLTLSAASHDSRTVTVNRAAGATITLPAASGSGARYRVVIGTTLTSGSLVIQVANASDVMQGFVMQMSDDPATMKAFQAAATSDTITLNRTTTGVGSKGEWFELQDVATNLWQVHGMTAATGIEATPFSAAV